MKKRLPIIVVVLILVVGLGSVRMKRAQQKNNAPLLKAVPMVVETAAVGHQMVANGRHVLGEVMGGDEADIAPRIMARVLAVKVRQGDPVTRGQLLAVLDKREQQDGFDAAKAGLEAAKIAFQTQTDATARDRVLFEAKAISQEQWDRSRSLVASFEAKLAAAHRNLKQAETRLSYTNLTAPVDGVVAERMIDPGDLVVPGKPVLKIVQQADVRVRAKLPQEDLARLAVGQTVTLSLGETTTTASVTRVFPAMDRSHLAVFEADLVSPPASFVAGATVGVDIAFASVEGLSVPVSALLDGENGSWVFKVQNEKIVPVQVKVLSAGSNHVAVSGDLAVGDKVVTARPSRLMMLSKDQPVRLAQRGGQS